MPRSHKRIVKVCEHCDRTFIAMQSSTRFCKDRECHKSRMRDYFREYYQRPVAKKKKLERNKDYQSRPDVKKKVSRQRKEYQSRDDVQERRRETARIRYANMTPEKKKEYQAYNQKYQETYRKKKRAEAKRIDEKLDAISRDNAPPIIRLTPEEYERKKAAEAATPAG